jgi:hypothetical protein
MPLVDGRDGALLEVAAVALSALGQQWAPTKILIAG